MAKRRYIGIFCFDLLYNFTALVYRSVESGALNSYSAKIHQYHEWLLDRDSTLISHFDTSIEGGVVPVSSMSACDTATRLDSGTVVHFGAHPTLTRVVHLWAGRRRWRPQRRKLKHIIFRRRSNAGKRMCDERMQQPGLPSDCSKYVAARVARHSKDTSFLPDQRADTISSKKQQLSALELGQP